MLILRFNKRFQHQNENRGCEKNVRDIGKGKAGWARGRDGAEVSEVGGRMSGSAKTTMVQASNVTWIRTVRWYSRRIDLPDALTSLFIFNIDSVNYVSATGVLRL